MGEVGPRGEMAAPDDETRLEQVENYEFAIHFGSASWPPMTVDEPPPRGKGAGVQGLAWSTQRESGRSA